MAEFTHAELRGARSSASTTAARFQAVDLSGATISKCRLVDVEITGYLQNVRLNGVDIGPLIEAELDRLHPERPKLRPTTADGYREGMGGHRGHLGRRRSSGPGELPLELLHERVDGEWSFIETAPPGVRDGRVGARAPSSASRPRTTRSTCRTTRSRRPRASRATATPGRP